MAIYEIKYKLKVIIQKVMSLVGYGTCDRCIYLCVIDIPYIQKQQGPF